MHQPVESGSTDELSEDLAAAYRNQQLNSKIGSTFLKMGANGHHSSVVAAEGGVEDSALGTLGTSYQGALGMINSYLINPIPEIIDEDGTVHSSLNMDRLAIDLNDPNGIHNFPKRESDVSVQVMPHIEDDSGESSVSTDVDEHKFKHKMHKMQHKMHKVQHKMHNMQRVNNGHNAHMHNPKISLMNEIGMNQSDIITKGAGDNITNNDDDDVSSESFSEDSTDVHVNHHKGTTATAGGTNGGYLTKD